ncbi:MAG: aminoglycoside 3'-phosphotransferase [Cyanobacteria bacterium P01_A01_bin.17]
MINNIELPKALKVLCSNYQVEEDTEGESPTEVFKLTKKSETLYLKIGHQKLANTTYSIDREKAVMLWLAEKIRVPKILGYWESDNHQFLLMTKLEGESLSEKQEADPDAFVDAFAEAIQQLQAIMIDDCPFDSGLDVRLRELKYLMDNDVAAYDDFVAGELPFSDAEGLYQHLLADEESRLPFRNPEELYQHLIETKFLEHKVFSHGDMSDGNILIDAQGRIEFIDWGRGGCADTWCDIAHAARNIRAELGEESQVQRFFKKLKIEEDRQKIMYHLLLDQLF